MTRPDLCVDFANTRFWRGSAAPTEQLQTRDDLRGWCRTAGLPDLAWSEADFMDALAPRARLTRVDGRYVWDVGTLDTAPLAPVAWSAADLLVRPLIDRVRLCANEKCRWLFLDESKSGNRRWCSMSACGNRAKAHRHYARQKEK
jgi:predicted RNA-binding Zn ribbon-like protein